MPLSAPQAIPRTRLQRPTLTRQADVINDRFFSDDVENWKLQVCVGADMDVGGVSVNEWVGNSIEVSWPQDPM